MSSSHAPAAQDDRELPYQPGSSTPLPTNAWLILFAAMALAYLLVITPWTPPLGDLGRVLRGALFVALPLLGLRLAAGGWWSAPVHAPTAQDVQWIVAGALLTMLASVGVALLLLHRTDIEVTPNPIVHELTRMPLPAFVALLLSTVPQLIGEELLAILPLLGVLALLTRHTQLPAAQAVALASVASCVLFAAAHLPTYDWNVLQCFSVLGVARLVLNFAYLRTRNLWVPIGAHVLTDWSYFVALVYGRDAS